MIETITLPAWVIYIGAPCLFLLGLCAGAAAVALWMAYRDETMREQGYLEGLEFAYREPGQDRP